jgi:hypothetical protein
MKHGAYPPEEVVQAVVYRYPSSAISGANLRMDAHMKNERLFRNRKGRKVEKCPSILKARKTCIRNQ